MSKFTKIFFICFMLSMSVLSKEKQSKESKKKLDNFNKYTLSK